MLEFIIMNGFHKVTCINKEEVTQLLIGFTLFTFLDPDNMNL